MKTKPKPKPKPKSKTFNLNKHSANTVINNKELEKGINIEREHGGTLKAIKDSINPKTCEIMLTDDEVFEMIAKEHLNEISDYYTRLEKMESE